MDFLEFGGNSIILILEKLLKSPERQIWMKNCLEVRIDIAWYFGIMIVVLLVPETLGMGVGSSIWRSLKSSCKFILILFGDKNIRLFWVICFFNSLEINSFERGISGILIPEISLLPEGNSRNVLLLLNFLILASCRRRIVLKLIPVVAPTTNKSLASSKDELQAPIGINFSA